MTRDLQKIKTSLAQIRAALDLLEDFVAQYEARSANILPAEDVQAYAATDDAIISGSGLGELTSLNQTIHQTAQLLAAAETAS